MADSMSDPRPIRVVLAEDEAGLRELVRMLLERSGRFTVVSEAGDGARAIELAEEHRPDVVLLDLRMPGLDGHRALPHLAVRCPETMVVVLSALAADRHEPHSLTLGAFAYLEKDVVADGALEDMLLDLYERFRGVLDGQVEVAAPIIVDERP